MTWTQWVKFVWPLIAVFTGLILAMLTWAVYIAY